MQKYDWQSPVYLQTRILWRWKDKLHRSKRIWRSQRSISKALTCSFSGFSHYFFSHFLFFHPHRHSTLETSWIIQTWYYFSLSDINECTEGSDDCHSKAECKNTIGNHQCTCKQGFYGDGRTSCTGQKEFGEVKDPCPKHWLVLSLGFSHFFFLIFCFFILTVIPH